MGRLPFQIPEEYLEAAKLLASKDERPSDNDELFLKLVAEQIYPDVARWLAPDDHDKDSVMDDLVDILSNEQDGYKLAHDLDHKGWDPDAELVEILDGVSHHRHTIESAMTALWVKHHGHVAFPPGTKVKVKAGKGSFRLDHKGHYIVHGNYDDQYKCLLKKPGQTEHSYPVVPQELLELYVEEPANASSV